MGMNGSGSGSGYVYGSGSGYGYVSGYDSGHGSGSGYGYGREDRDEYLMAVKHKLDAKWVLAEANSELKREMIEVMGSDRFFSQLKGKEIHRDIDYYGNLRLLLKIPLPETKVGFLLAVKVTCPTTKRIYYLGVPPDVRTCQEAVASTFGIAPDEYHPGRET